MSSLDFGWGMKQQSPLQNQSKHYNVASMSGELHLVWPLQSLSSIVKLNWGENFRANMNQRNFVWDINGFVVMKMGIWEIGKHECASK